MDNFNKKILIPLANPPKSYVNALIKVGLEPSCSFSPKNLQDFAGLLLTGGGDVLSSFYNSHIPCQQVNFFRDFNEFFLVDYFFKLNKPILGICRGMQLINVYLGGTLKTVSCHSLFTGDVSHPVIPPKNGFLSKLSQVNSNHVQAVDKLCPFSYDVMKSLDGVVEGFCFGKNIIAVQFHPERMNDFAINAIYGKFAQLVILNQN